MSTAARQRTPATEALRAIQAPVRERLELVVHEMHKIVSSELPMIEQVSAHLLRMRGKMFRPTLTLLCSSVDGESDSRAIRLAAVVELMHLATLVHDDSVDHSVLRRGLPTVNSLFSHQVSVIMGDFLYTRAHAALVEVGDLEFLRILTAVANERCGDWIDTWSGNVLAPATVAANATTVAVSPFAGDVGLRLETCAKG